MTPPTLPDLIAAVQAWERALRPWPVEGANEGKLSADARDNRARATAKADLLAAVIARLQWLAEPKTCETCKHNGAVLVSLRSCKLLSERVFGQKWGSSPNHLVCVPLTIHGQPFGCAGHEPKETTDAGSQS